MSTSDPQLITDADLAGVTKNVYAAYRVKTFPILTPLLANVKKASPGGPEHMQWGGKGVFWDVVLTRPVGATSSNAGYFPPTAAAKEKQATLGIFRTYVTRHLDALTDSGTQSKNAAYVRYAEKIMQEAIDAGTLMQQEVLNGNGTGIKAIVTVTNTTTSFTVSSPYGISGAGEGGLWVAEDMYLAIRDTTGATLRGKAFVTLVVNNGDNAVITLGTPVTGIAVGDVLISATTSDDSYGAYPNGLANITNRGGAYNSFEGIDASVDARWNATQLIAGTDTPDATQPNEMDIYKLIRRVKGRSGKDATLKPKEFLLLTTPGLVKKFGESLLGQRRWEMGTDQIKGGFGTYTCCGLPMVEDPSVPAGTVYLVHLPSLTWVDRQDWVKLQFEGSGPWRFIPGRDAYELSMGAYWNFGALQRNAHGSITGFVDTDRYSWVQ